MADGGYIREYLVGLGFQVDSAGLEAFRAALEGAQNCGVLSWTLCDALTGGAAQFTGEPMEARINEAALPTAEPTAESAATDQPNG